MLRTQRLLASILLTLVSGCGTGYRLVPVAENNCPGLIKAGPDLVNSGIEWGEDSSKIYGNIISVAVECYPIRHPDTEILSTKATSETRYQIASTASVKYSIPDKRSLWLGNDATIIFEALSASRVVLGSAQGTFRFVKGGTSGTVSAIIEGLSSEAVRKIDSVHARWKYGV